uniref:NADH dehydrogenase [ubiquinone] iron-sulfur protein 6, mitochondrial n=1 Tax=Glossina pallidipes TaxID=7398 RepID=A0A1A9Z7W4_GLOPL
MACRKIICDFPILNRSNKKVVAQASSNLARNYSQRSDLQTVTHTGQVFDEDDYRNVRFTNAKRYVNENWGIKLVNEIPPKECKERVVYCDGGDGPLGHPKVYINLDKPGAHACGYCGLRFVKKDAHH